MKLDLLNEFCDYTNKRKFYFVAEPHIIYWDNEENSLYYELLLGGARAKITGINLNEWNLFTIKVDQKKKSIYVYTNFNFYKPEVSVENLSSEYDLSMLNLAFCSGDEFCFMKYSYIGEIRLIWGAAYYKNLKIWDITKSSEYLIQEFNYYRDQVNNYEVAQSIYGLAYDFPFNLRNSDNYYIKSTVSNTGIDFYKNYKSTNLFNDDREPMVNYGTKFFFESGKFISYQNETTYEISRSDCDSSCLECILSDRNHCTKCPKGFKLYASFCKPITGYFLKTPLTIYTNKAISFNFLNLAKYFTLTIWIKYLSMLNREADYNDLCVIILNFKEDKSRYLCYSSYSRELRFYEKDKILYTVKDFNRYIGKWVLISFTSLQNTDKDFNPLNRLYIQDEEIQRNYNTTINNNEIIFDTLEIGNEFLGLIGDINLYKNVIINPFGYVTNSFNRDHTIITRLKLYGASISSCISDNYLVLPKYRDIVKVEGTLYKALGVSCVEDYHPYLSSACPNVNSFYSIDKLNEIDPPCLNCDSSCSGACVNSNANKCTCDFETANNWLLYDNSTDSYSCESIPYVEFSKINTTIVGNISISKDEEYSIDFWMFIYSYNNTQLLFENFEIIWDKHMMIKISKNETIDNNSTENPIKITCLPIVDVNSTWVEINNDTTVYDFNYTKANDFNNNNFTEIYANSTNHWVHVICSVDYRRMKYFLNENDEKTIITDSNSESMLNLTSYKNNNNKTTLIFTPGDPNLKLTRTNYGFLLIREFKIYSIYDVRKLATKCFPIPNYFQGILHYFSNNKFSNTLMDLLDYSIKSKLVKRSDFIGYNVIDHIKKKDILFLENQPCSSLLMVPTVGIVLQTEFNFKANLTTYGDFTNYKFFYQIKKSKYIELISNITSNDEVNHIFNIPTEQVYDNKMDLYIICEIYNDEKNATLGIPSMVLFRELSVYIKLKFHLENSYNLILQDLKVNNAMSTYQIQLKSNVLSSIQSDLLSPNYESSIKCSKNVNSLLPIDTNLPNCNPSLCNNRGVCYSNGCITNCACYSGYIGANCEISKDNYNVWKQGFDATVEAMDYRVFIYNQTGLILDNSLLNSADVLLDSVVSSVQRFEDLEPFFNLLDNVIVKFNDKISTTKEVEASFNNFHNMVSSIYLFSIKQMNRRSEENVKEYADSGVTVSTLGTLDLTGVNYSVTYIGYRNLQENITITDNSNYFVSFSDPYSNTILLTDDQKSYYRDKLMMWKKYVLDSAYGIVISNYNNTNGSYEYTYSNSEFELVVKNFNSTHIQEFDFREYFNDKRESNRSYFDAYNCLNEMISKNDSGYDLSSITFYFVEFKINLFHFDFNLYSSSITNSHVLKFYDAKLNEIKINKKICDSGITHYSVFFPYNRNFKNDFNRFSPKYTKDFNKEGIQYYFYPYYIFDDGIIDHSPLNEQKDKYYKKFVLRISYLSNRTDNASDDIYKYSVSQKNYILNNTFVESLTDVSGEFAVFAFDEDVKFRDKPHYYFKKAQIFTCGDNYLHNMCFYVVFLLGIFFVATILYMLFNNLYYKSTKSKQFGDVLVELKYSLDDEFKILLDDNVKFGLNRYEIYYDLKIEEPKINNEAAKTDFIIDDPNKAILKTDNNNQFQYMDALKISSDSSEKFDYDYNKLNGHDLDVYPRKFENYDYNFIQDPVKQAAPHKWRTNNVMKIKRIEIMQELSESNRPQVQEEAPILDIPEITPKSKGSRLKLLDAPKQQDVHIELSDKDKSPNEIQREISLRIKTEVHDLSLKHSNSEFLHKKVKLKTKDSLKDTHQWLYNPFHFIFCRNIYMNNMTFNAPLHPRWKIFTKFVLFLYLILLVVCVEFVFMGTMDFTVIIFNKFLE